MAERPRTHADRAGGAPGWEPHESDRSFDPLEGESWRPPPPRGRVDLSPLFGLLDAAIRAVPRDVRDQFVALVREALLTLRALIDWYLDRLDSRRHEPDVEDIPID
jgi:hypothetical protein